MRMNPHQEDKDKACLPRCLRRSTSSSGVRAENASPKGNPPGFRSSLPLNAGNSFSSSPVGSKCTPRRKLTLSLCAQMKKPSPCIPIRHPSVRKGSQDSSGLLDRGDGTKGEADRSSPQLEQSPLQKHQPVDPLEPQANKLKKQRHLDVQTPVSFQHSYPGDSKPLGSSRDSKPLGSSRDSKLLGSSRDSKPLGSSRDTKPLGSSRDTKPLGFSRDTNPLGFFCHSQCSLHTKCNSHQSSLEAFEDMRWYEIPLSSPRKHESGLFSKKFQTSLKEYRRQREMRKKRKASPGALCTYMLKPAIVCVERLPQEKIQVETKCSSSKDGDMSKTDFVLPTQGAVKSSKAVPKQLSSLKHALADSPEPSVQSYPYCATASCCSKTFSPSKKVVTPSKRAMESSNNNSGSKKRKKELTADPAPVPAPEPLNRDSPDQQLQDQPLLPLRDFHLDTGRKKASSSCDSVYAYLDTMCSSFSHASDGSDGMFPLDWSPPRIDFLYQKALPDPMPLSPGNIIGLMKTKHGDSAGVGELEEQRAVDSECAHHTSGDTGPCAEEGMILLEVRMLEDFVVNESLQSAEEAVNTSQERRRCKSSLEGSELPSLSNQAEMDSSVVMDSMLEYLPLTFAKAPEEQSLIVSSDSSRSPAVLGWNRESLAIAWDSEEEQDEGLVKMDDLFQPMKSMAECTLQMAIPVQATSQEMQSVNLMSGSYHQWFIPPVASLSEDYSNNLDYLLQEKLQGEHVVLEEKLEKSLKECLLLGQGFDHSSTSGEEASLMEEHRLFIQRYSVSTDGIPSTYPGEDLFIQPQNPQLWNQGSSFALDMTELDSRNALEHLLFSSSFTQQLSFIRDGFLRFLYRCLPCPQPVLHWLFQLLAAPPEVSMDCFKVLWDISMDGMVKSEDATGSIWCPSLQEIITVFQNLGARPSVLYPGGSPQRQRIPRACCMPLLQDSGTRSTGFRTGLDGSMQGAAAKIPLATNLSHVFKFLTLCVAAHPRWYTDCELLMLVRMLCKTSLDRALRNQPKEDLRQLLATLLDNISSWEKKLPDLCLCLSQLSDHHHNLLSVVQHIPDITDRGRQLQRLVSLAVIAKVLEKKPRVHCWKEGTQLPTLCRFISSMKPSSLKQHLEQARRAEDPQPMEEQLNLDREAYYLCHSLLVLANVVVGTEAIPLNRWNDLHALCIQLDQQITSNIRENPQQMYRSKLKDLAVGTHVKWQELLAQKLHTCWGVAPCPVYNSLEQQPGL